MSFSGRFHQIDRANLTLRPNRQIPIYCGGFTEPAFRRAAKMADGFIFATFDPTRDWPQVQWRWSRLHELLQEHGRRAEDFVTITLCQPTDSFSYTASEIAETAARLRDLGVKEYSIASSNRGLATVEQHLDFLETAKAKVDAALSGG